MASETPRDPAPRPRDPADLERVLADDDLVEAARAGRLHGEADVLSQLLDLLRECATGSCVCPSRDRCAVRGAGGRPPV